MYFPVPPFQISKYATVASVCFRHVRGRFVSSLDQTNSYTLITAFILSRGAGHFGHKTLRHQDTLGHFGTTKLVLKFKPNHRWRCVSSELSWVKVFRIFLDRVEVSRTTFLVSKCLETGAEVSQSVLMPKCLVAEVSGNPQQTGL